MTDKPFTFREAGEVSRDVFNALIGSEPEYSYCYRIKKLEQEFQDLRSKLAEFESWKSLTGGHYDRTKEFEQQLQEKDREITELKENQEKHAEAINYIIEIQGQMGDKRTALKDVRTEIIAKIGDRAFSEIEAEWKTIIEKDRNMVNDGGCISGAEVQLWMSARWHGYTEDFRMHGQGIDMEGTGPGDMWKWNRYAMFLITWHYGLHDITDACLEMIDCEIERYKRVYAWNIYGVKDSDIPAMLRGE